jgi:carboxypeptidase PM20D1
MNRIVIGLVAVIAVLVAIVLVRTQMALAPPQAELVPPPPLYVDSRVVARHLSQAIRFQTVSYDGGAHRAGELAALDAMRAWMAKTYPDFFKTATLEAFDRSLLFTWTGKNPKLAPVLLLAHLDVAPVVPGTERDWSHPPFSGAIADGYVWGRGSIDGKATAIVLLEAAERLAREGFTPQRTVMFAFGQDAESGSRGDAVIAAALAGRGVHFDFVLDDGGAVMDEPFPGIEQPVAFVSVREKGYLNLRLVAHGLSGNAVRPTGDMAIVRLARAVQRVVDHPFRSGIDRVQREKLSVLASVAPFPTRLLLSNLWLTGPIVEHYMKISPDGVACLSTTIAPTLISGGVQGNVLPPHASATIALGIDPRDTIKSAIAHVRDAIHDPNVNVIAITQTQSKPSRTSDLHSPAGEFLIHEIAGTFGDVPVAPDIAADDAGARYYQPIASQVFGFAPFQFGADDLARVHGTNERVAIGDLGRGTVFFMRLMRDLR